MQKRSNSIANALEVHLSCTNPSIWRIMYGMEWHTIYMFTIVLFHVNNKITLEWVHKQFITTVHDFISYTIFESVNDDQEDDLPTSTLSWSSLTLFVWWCMMMSQSIVYDDVCMMCVWWCVYDDVTINCAMHYGTWQLLCGQKSNNWVIYHFHKKSDI